MPALRALACYVVLMLAGCASQDWSRADTVAELSWQALNIVDARQTAEIHETPGIRETDPLTRRILGRQPDPSETYQLMATYAVSHYVISRSLPPRWRKYWHAATLAPKAAVVYDNHKAGL